MHFNKKIFSRLIQALIVLVGISFFTFSLVYLSPGDPAESMLTACGNVPSPELLAQTRAELGLDKPFIEQYIDWGSKILQGDFGTSYSLRIPVIQKIKEAFIPTLALALLSLFMTLLISLPCGILSAIKENKIPDYLIRMFTFIGISVPNFWMGLIFLSIFGVQLHWVSVSGGTADFRSIILPALTLALAMSSKYTRQVRHVFLTELDKPYVNGARMRGINEKTILWKHILPNAMLPLITLFGLSFGSLLGGTAVVEIIYNWPGMGNMAIKAISFRDYPLIQAYVLLIALIYLLINTLVDISYRYFDSRIKED